MKNYRCTECGMVLPNVPDDKHPRFCPYCMGELKPDEVSNDWMIMMKTCGTRKGSPAFLPLLRMNTGA